MRKLCESGRVPNNALVVRKELPAAQREKLVQALLGMAGDPAAAPVLAGLEVKRFAPCAIGEYKPLYEMIDKIGPMWFVMDIGPAPKVTDTATRGRGDAATAAGMGTTTRGGM